MYETQLLKYYPQFSLDFIQYDLPLCQGWARIASGMEADGWIQFSGLKVKNGYIAQEVDRLMQIAKDYHARQKSISRI